MKVKNIFIFIEIFNNLFLLDSRVKILFLCGCSGCGKSTLVEVLCRVCFFTHSFIYCIINSLLIVLLFSLQKNIFLYLQELGITLLEWSADTSDYSTTSSSSSNSFSRFNSKFSYQSNLLPVDQYLADSSSNQKYSPFVSSFKSLSFSKSYYFYLE